MKVIFSLDEQAQGTSVKVISSLCPVSGLLCEGDLLPGWTGSGHLPEGDLIPVPSLGAAP